MVTVRHSTLCLRVFKSIDDAGIVNILISINWKPNPNHSIFGRSDQFRKSHAGGPFDQLRPTNEQGFSRIRILQIWSISSFMYVLFLDSGWLIYPDVCILCFQNMPTVPQSVLWGIRNTHKNTIISHGTSTKVSDKMKSSKKLTHVPVRVTFLDFKS